MRDKPKLNLGLEPECWDDRDGTDRKEQASMKTEGKEVQSTA